MSLFEAVQETPNQLATYPVPVELLSNKPGPGQKPAHMRKDITAKHAAFALLREAGAGPSQAAAVLGLSANTGTRIEKKLNAYELQRDKLVSLATKTTRNFIQGKPVGGTITTDPLTGKPVLTGAVVPKGSDVMRAVELVMDREQPKVTLSASITAEFMPIDLADYQ